MGGHWGLAADGGGEQVHHLVKREVADACEDAEEEARHDDHHGRVAELRPGGPARLLELADHFAYEDASALERIFHGLLWETF